MFYFCDYMMKEKLDILDVENAVAKLFGVDREGFYARLGVKNLYTARHFLWLFLHDEYGMSNREISKMYIHSKRMVEKAISGMRFRVGNQPQDRKVYEELKSSLLI